jgi:hypothetical protein
MCYRVPGRSESGSIAEEERIRSGQYHSAAVGACPSDGKTGFSSYRVAVALYE